MHAAPRRAMVLAAGYGLRLRPLTDTVPKPLIPVAGRTMLDRALDHLDASGVAEAVVNSHYLADQIAAHLARRDTPHTQVSYEEVLLDTGGGIAHALDLLGPDAFYAANGDIIWRDGAASALARLAEAWREGAMDGLLLLQPVERAIGYDGNGDFGLDSDARLFRRGAATRAPYVFTGVQILHPVLFGGCPSGPFSLNVLYDRAIAAGRLFGLVHDGEWYHVGTPDALREAERLISEREGARRGTC